MTQASPALNETRLPRAVLRRSAAIQAHLDEQKKQRESDASAADPPLPATPSAEAAPPVVPSSPTPTPAAAPAPDPRENDLTYWKQRFNVTAGYLRLERDARAADQAEFNQRLAEKDDQIRVLQEQATTPPTLDLTSVLTKDQIETLGEDEARAVVETAQKVARDAVQKAIEAQVKPLRDAQERGAAKARIDDQAAFLDALAEIVPDFNEVNETDGWKEWLAEDDEVSGVQRQLILDQHVSRRDPKKVAALFNAYKQLAAGATPVPPVSPQGTGATPPGAPPDQKVPRALTKAEIREFYKRASIGKVTDAERSEFEARLKLRAGR